MKIDRHQLNIPTADTPVAYSQIKGGQVAAHFLPANGFTFGCYRQLLTQLAPKLSLTGMDVRPTWPDIGPPPRNHSWDLYLEDLIAFLDALKPGPVIGIGHSMGAITTLRAAAKRPDLFSALILLEPALYPAAWIRIANMIPWRYKLKFKPVAMALARQDVWKNRPAALADLKDKKMFLRFPPEVIADFVDYALADAGQDAGGGACGLMFRKDWEARIYGEPPKFWNEFQWVTHPVLGVKGKKSFDFLEGQYRKWRKMRPADTHHYIDGGSHLLPLENPTATAAVINNWLETI